MQFQKTIYIHIVHQVLTPFVTRGYLWSVSELMKIKAMDLTELERIIVLSFDEVHLTSDISYDITTDSIIGPHSKVEVGLARGLFKNYKIPIYYKFHRKGIVLEPDDFQKIITDLQNEGYHVMGMVCDNARTNQKLARLLGVTEETPFFKNPSKPGNIYWLYDACHLLKLIRSYLIDEGFRFSENPSTKIGPKELEKMLRDRGTSEKTKVTILHKLDIEKHLKVPSINDVTILLATFITAF